MKSFFLLGGTGLDFKVYGNTRCKIQPNTLRGKLLMYSALLEGMSASPLNFPEPSAPQVGLGLRVVGFGVWGSGWLIQFPCISPYRPIRYDPSALRIPMRAASWVECQLEV